MTDTNNAGRPAAVPSMSKWQHTTDPLHIRRLGKTGEELAELAAVVSRCLIQGLDEIDPSSGKTNRQRFIDETADVRAQLNCNDRAFGLPLAEIAARVAKKEAWMAEWESHYGAALAQPPEAPAARLPPDSGEVSRLAEERQDAARLRALLRNNGREFDLSNPDRTTPKSLRLTLNCEGCEQYRPDGAVDFAATIRAVLDDEIRLASLRDQPGAQP